MKKKPNSQVDPKEFLRPLLFGLAEEDLHDLSKAAVLRSFEPGTVICREGEPGDVMYFIVQGCVEIVKQLDEQRERFLHELGPGEYFGEMAILQQSVRTATVRTVAPTLAVEIGQEPFLTVLGRSPALGMRFLVLLTSRLRDADQQAIDELSKANAELRQALQRLERLDRTKSDFIRVSAHELRTPVAALLGYAQMMRNHTAVQNDGVLKSLVDGIEKGTDRLHRVFNSILDLSKVLTAGLDVRVGPVSFNVIFEGIRVGLERALQDRNLSLVTTGIEDLPMYLGDPDLLYKVFYHLVNNAVKYTPDGGQITARGRVLDVPGMGRSVEVAVEDSGIGIAPQDLDLIFEKFYRTGEVALHSSGTVSFKGGGPGLGLAIARGIVMAHGGHIWAESSGYDEEKCPGSRFVVQLPLVEPVTT